jgi:invasion protein IalB
MTALFRTSALALILTAAGLAAVAQEATEGAEATTEAPATEAPAGEVGGALSMGSSTEPAVGQLYVKAEYGDWDLRCVRTETGVDPCQLYQLLNDADGNSVAEISMFPLPEGSRAAAGATIVAPLETLLTEQVVITVDGGTAKTYPFTFCNAGGCVARVGFTTEDIAAFKNGSSATLRIVPAVAPDQVVELTISLTGFTAGFDFQVEAAAGDTTGE